MASKLATRVSLLPIRKAIPGRPVSAKWLNDMAVVAEKNRLARSNLMDGTNGEGGTGTRPADYNPLLIFKVTGTTTGGYTFEEVTDPDADGTYTTADSGLSSTGTGLVLVASSTLTLATNDIVLVRRNPLYTEKYETLSVLKSGGGSLTTHLASAASSVALSSSSGAWTDIVSVTLSLSVPYLVQYMITGELLAATVGSLISSRISYNAGSVNVAQGIVTYQHVASTYTLQTISGFYFITPSSTGVVKLQASRVYSGAITTSNIVNGGSIHSTFIQALQLSL